MQNAPSERGKFAHKVGTLHLTQAERAVAYLWYYRQKQQFEERTAAELADDLNEDGFPRPNVTRLHDELKKNKFTTKGRRAKTFQLDVRGVPELYDKYGPLLKIKAVQVSDSVVPGDWVIGTRPYLEKMVHQINGSYDYGFYDGCAVLCRRLMESLIIEIYISRSIQDEIRQNSVFIMLDAIIARIRSHATIKLGRNTSKTMIAVKELGDTAAHDRTYITECQDIDDVKPAYRRMVQELLSLASITPKPR